MAEAFLNQLAGDHFVAESAGLEPGRLNPIAIETMREAGLDISRQSTKSVSAMIERGPHFDYVVTVCDETSAERCPMFPGKVTRLHWPFPDPSSFSGTMEEKMKKTRQVRDEIREKVRSWAANT
jgi:arsenate reductase